MKVIVVTVTYKNQVNDQFVFDFHDRDAAENEFINQIVRHDGEVVDKYHREALIGDGVCDIQYGQVSINFLEYINKSN